MIEPATNRDTLRAELRARRRMAAAEHPNAATDALAHFKQVVLPDGAIVAAYIAVNSEMDPATLMKFLAAQKMQLCLPAVTAAAQPMRFRAYCMGDALIQNNLFPFPEPASGQPIVTPNVLLVPLLGFDRTGNRIGSGKGFYDRTLAKLRAQNNVIAIGLAYAEQEVAAIPAAPHDQSLNIIVTPREVIYCPVP